MKLLKMYPGCPFCKTCVTAHCSCPAEFIQFSMGNNIHDKKGLLRTFGLNIDNKWRFVVNYELSYTEVMERKDDITGNTILRLKYATVVPDLTTLSEKIPMWITFS